jgi:hypothetical protein
MDRPFIITAVRTPADGLVLMVCPIRKDIVK